jgi:hypothetical protein
MEHAVRNTSSNVEKLRRAWTRTLRAAGNDPSVGIITYRHMASLFGLAWYMAATVGQELRNFFSLLRTHSRLHTRGGLDGWDKALEFVSPTIIRDLRPLVELLLKNHAVIPTFIEQAFSIEDADIVILTDASGDGFGGYIFERQGAHLHVVQQRWPQVRDFGSSTVAEPSAAASMLRIAKLLPAAQGPAKKIAVITDHQAIVTGQRRTWSNSGGFCSGNFFLNSLYLEAYGASNSPDNAHDVQFFFVPGEANVADPLSRHFGLLAPGVLSVRQVVDGRVVPF